MDTLTEQRLREMEAEMSRYITLFLLLFLRFNWRIFFSNKLSCFPEFFFDTFRRFFFDFISFFHR